MVSTLLVKGLTFGDPNIDPFILGLRAECYAQKQDISSALSDIKTAIDSLTKIAPDNYYDLERFHIISAKIKIQNKDLAGAAKDDDLSKNYKRKFEGVDVETDNDLPF